MPEMTLRLDRELHNALRRMAAEETAATKEQVSIASIIRTALRDFAARRATSQTQRITQGGQNAPR